MDDDHFKHLGKDLLADFSEAQAKKKVLAKLNEYVDLVDGTLLDDIPKPVSYTHLTLPTILLV